MTEPYRFRSWVTRLLLVGLGMAWFGGVATRQGFGQVSPEEHKKHHPGGSDKGPPGFARGPRQGMMGGTPGMGSSPPKELFPSLMSLPELTPEQRREIETQAESRMRSGAALWSEGLDRLTRATEQEDYQQMQEALAQVREGLEQFESGLAARRALAEGKPPRSVALEWFKREMNLLPESEEDSGFRLWGMTAFHTAIMAGLVLFAGAVLAMYYFKMQRAEALLRSLTGTPGGDSPSPQKEQAPSAPPSAPSSSSAHLVSPSEPHPRQGDAKQQPWSGQLRVSQIFQETHNVKTLRLMNPLGGSIPFQHLPGQFLTVSVAPGRKSAKRSYTMACSPTQHDCIEITVKREEPGLVSDYLHNVVNVGDLLDIVAPLGSFVFTGREADSVVLIGGGVGITPLMSVTRYLTDRSWPGEIFFLYACHSPKEFIFEDELEYLQRRHPNLHLAVTVSDAEGADWTGATGRISKEFLSREVSEIERRRIHICGPRGMMDAVTQMLLDLGVPRQQIKTEAFGPARGKQVAQPHEVAASHPGDEQSNTSSLPTVTFSNSGVSGPMSADKTVLDVADEVGVEIDNSCRIGVCGTCKVRLLSGKATMEVEDSLDPEEKAQGVVLACQAKSSENLEVEA